MATSLYDLSVGSYKQIVASAAGVLAKGAQHCAENDIDPADIVATSLHPDMATFHFQVVCIYHHSMGAVNAIKSGEFSPPSGYPDTDYAGLHALIDKGMDELNAIDAHELNQHADGKIIFKLGGNEIPFTTENFILSFSLPNFYFHATTAYDILRSRGVAIGKLDFLGPLRMGA